MNNKKKLAVAILSVLVVISLLFTKDSLEVTDNSEAMPLSLRSSSSGSVAAAAVADATTATERVDEATIQTVREHGVDRVYLELFNKAKTLADEDYGKHHNNGLMGVVIGPTEGRFDYTWKAIKNGARIRNIMQKHPEGKERKQIRLALVTSRQHVDELKKCGQLKSEACKIWTKFNGTLFDDVIQTDEDLPYKGNDNHTDLKQGTSKFWLKALGGYRLAPYRHSLFLDSDAYLCPGFEALFQFSNSDAGYKNHWQVPIVGSGDLTIGLEQFVHDKKKLDKWIPGNEDALSDFARFQLRNTGTVLFNFERRFGHHFAHFIPLVAEHIYNNVATPQKKVTNDQWPFRIALYLFKRLHPHFVEHNFPMHTSCRSYPGQKYAGTDGFLNGMFPMQPDGKHCSECSCTPCLVNHCRGYTVKINGNLGWEDDFEYDQNYQRKSTL
mmetsp:Transcript_5350/g.7712  ORF Transcript_5350/g.7712 Transcript_5350/m.7712 type:complete len:440 (-) Transcript_5350:20-1339(-)